MPPIAAEHRRKLAKTAEQCTHLHHAASGRIILPKAVLYIRCTFGASRVDQALRRPARWAWEDS
eukprot:8008579-Alexandrium_andersonii.AAC.1